ncbi:VOC family protein [Paraglaciecola sp. 2405UD69-4]|uniref:VOC family protein n=1 Tax=Paraglaciecola sp. 2405UD69-4 TaxID=3391836 RepID=UPI0039C9D244
MKKAEVGSITWRDLTVNNAAEVAEFYQSVIGWKTSPVNMGDYEDYAMSTPATEEGVAGVCHAKGPNSSLPAQWLMYVKVENLQESLEQVLALGGKVLTDVKKLSDTSYYAVIKDPAGAVCAIYDE